eukprot:UN24708
MNPPSVQEAMPPRWEKRLDKNTNRYYFVDHSTQKTQWIPPSLEQSDECVRLILGKNGFDFQDFCAWFSRNSKSLERDMMILTELPGYFSDMLGKFCNENNKNL